MSLILHNFKTFREFLIEANYGSLQNDSRIKELADMITKDMDTTLKVIPVSKLDFSGKVRSTIKTKYKSDSNVDITITWKFTTDILTVESKNITKGATSHLSENLNDIIIEFHLLKYEDESDKAFRRKLISYVGESIDIELLHEVKHILDYIDGIFTDKHMSKYHYPKSYSKDELSKYHSQPQEIHNFLISVISELDKIRKSNPNISFKEAIEKSKYYKQVTLLLNKDVLNKFKAKVVHYWYINNET